MEVRALPIQEPIRTVALHDFPVARNWGVQELAVEALGAAACEHNLLVPAAVGHSNAGVYVAASVCETTASDCAASVNGLRVSSN